MLRKYNLPFEDRNIIADRAQRQQMIEKSGQTLSPCVEVDGRMLPDISGEELEDYLVVNGYVARSDAPADMPVNRPCPHEVPEPRAARCS